MEIAVSVLKRVGQWLLAGGLVLFCTGCMGPHHFKSPENSSLEPSGAMLNALAPANEIQSLVKQGLIALQVNHDYQKAADIFKKGLKLNPANGHLHFLLALCYHKMSLSGDMAFLDLAESGYRTALRLDTANWQAAFLLGHLYWERKQFTDAREQFAYALMYKPGNLDVLKALSVSAYYGGDLSLAQWAAKKAYAIDPDSIHAIRSVLFSTAAAGNIDGARSIFSAYQQRSSAALDRGQPYPGIHTADMVLQRINDWEGYYTYAANTVFTGDSDTEDILGGSTGADDGEDTEMAGSAPDAGTPASNDSTAASQPAPGQALPRMALIDVVILRTEEVRSQSKGINLLDGLRTTFSGTLFGLDWSKGRNAAGQSTDAHSIYIAASFTLMDLEYNLNLFNDSNNRAEVLARPSLLAIEHETSRFFSGTELQVQLSSNNSDGSMVNVPIGIQLQVTPTFYGNDNIKVTIHASKAFLETLAEEVGFTAFSQTAKTSVDATAVLKFGETLILSGLTENESEKTKSGVPVLQSVPGVQYLFSKDAQSETKKSILILLTPRKARYMDDTTSISHLKEAARERSGGSAYTSELKKKENISANTDALFVRLSEESSFYRQFRSGDLTLETWNNSDTIRGAIQRVLGFIYY